MGLPLNDSSFSFSPSFYSHDNDAHHGNNFANANTTHIIIIIHTQLPHLHDCPMTWTTRRTISSIGHKRRPSQTALPSSSSPSSTSSSSTAKKEDEESGIIPTSGGKVVASQKPVLLPHNHHALGKQQPPLTQSPSSTLKSTILPSSSPSSNSHAPSSDVQQSVTPHSLMPSVSSIRKGFLNQFQKPSHVSPTGQRFLSKSGKLSSCPGLSRFASHQNLCFNASTNDYQALDSSQNAMNGTTTPVTNAVIGGQRVRKGSISAESKIQEELREMRAREEELK